MNYETIELTYAEGIATVILNRVANRNALNLRMCEELFEVITAIATNVEVRVVLVRGNGPAFCAGADLKERKGMTVDQVRERRIKGFAAYGAIERLPQPAIALVHGAVVGSGCEIAAACDFILATDDTTFRYPEVGWGTVGATQRLPRIVGVRMAKELLFTGRAVDAKEARELGLVNRVLAKTELDAEAFKLAQAIAAAPPVGMRLTKRCVDAGVETTRAGALELELAAIEENLARGNWQAAIADFGTKKP
jgi:enoyl-CoA hydratase